MIVYLDESYDTEYKQWLLIGVLFVPHSRFLYRKMKQKKESENWVDSQGNLKEIKYSDCISTRILRIAQGCVDAFVESTSYFRCIAVEVGHPDFDWSFFGDPVANMALVRARAYKKFSEIILKSNVYFVRGATLLVDRMSRCRGDHFLEIMTNEFGTPNIGHSEGSTIPVFNIIREVDTAHQRYQVGQLADLLTGSVLNELMQVAHKKKRALREHVQEVLGLPTLSPQYWAKLSKPKADDLHPKYQVFYWDPNWAGE